MMRVVLALVLFCTTAHAQTLQDQLDAIGANGGKIMLGCGQFPGTNGTPLLVKNYTIIQGSGHCTEIGPIRARDAGQNAGGTRAWGLELHSLRINPALAVSPYIAADFRNTTKGKIIGVNVMSGFQTGVLAAHSALSLSIAWSDIRGSVDGLEIYSTDPSYPPNQISVIGGSIGGPIPVNVIGTMNGLSLHGGVSLEMYDNGSSPRGIVINETNYLPGATLPSGIGFSLQGTRAEGPNYGPYFW